MSITFATFRDDGMPPFPIALYFVDNSVEPMWRLVFHNPEVWLSEPTTTEERILLWVDFCQRWFPGWYPKFQIAAAPGRSILHPLLQIFADHAAIQINLNQKAAKKAMKHLRKILNSFTPQLELDK